MEIRDSKPFRDEAQRFVLRTVFDGVCRMADTHGIARDKAMGYVGAITRSLSKTTDFTLFAVADRLDKEDDDGK